VRPHWRFGRLGQEKDRGLRGHFEIARARAAQIKAAGRPALSAFPVQPRTNRGEQQRRRLVLLSKAAFRIDRRRANQRCSAILILINIASRTDVDSHENRARLWASETRLKFFARGIVRIDWKDRRVLVRSPAITSCNGRPTYLPRVPRHSSRLQPGIGANCLCVHLSDAGDPRSDQRATRVPNESSVRPYGIESRGICSEQSRSRIDQMNLYLRKLPRDDDKIKMSIGSSRATYQRWILGR